MLETQGTVRRVAHGMKANESAVVFVEQFSMHRATRSSKALTAPPRQLAAYDGGGGYGQWYYRYQDRVCYCMKQTLYNRDNRQKIQLIIKN